ncbi:MAG: NAD(P)/FAD-dependent oxidoreductase, partial [Gemmatimonadales bacterium]
RGIGRPTGVLQDIDPVRKEIRLQNGETIAWRSLVLATGAHSFVPPVPGVKREGVSVLRSKADADYILAACRESGHCAIIGGGLLGLETAGALARQGAEVTVLDHAPWLLSRQLTRRAAEILEARVLALGIRVRKECRVKELEGDERVREVRFENGDSLPADLVVLSAGVRPNLYAARAAGLTVNNGVVVDDSLRTSAPDIYAAGDLCEHAGLLYGLWAPAQLHGAAAGTNAAAGQALFRGIPRAATIKVLGIGMMSAGDVHSPELEIREEEAGGNYRLLAFRDGKLAGAILLGDISRAAAVKQALETGAASL